MRYYDSRVLGYFSLLNAPLQAAVLGLYKDSPKSSARLLTASLIAPGITIGTWLTARWIYENLHDEFQPKNPEHFYLPYTTEIVYNRQKAFIRNEPYPDRAGAEKRLDAIAETSSMYSANLIKLSALSVGASVAFGSIVGYKKFKSLPKALAYGVFVPAVIALEEAKELRGKL